MSSKINGLTRYHGNQCLWFGTGPMLCNRCVWPWCVARQGGGGGGGASVANVTAACAAALMKVRSLMS